MNFPVSLTIAGSDSGGGAGIQADLRAFSFFNVFGTTAITCLTAQNPLSVTDIFPASPHNLRQQIFAVLSAFDVKSIKTGMLFSEQLIECVNDILSESKAQLIIDPVMVATSGAKLLQDDAIRKMTSDLLPKAALVTPNIPEAEILLGGRISKAQTAAIQLADTFQVPVLLKGGHGKGDATDYLVFENECWEFRTPMIDAKSSHGTGCSLSAAIAANLAAGCSLVDAVWKAKAYVFGLLQNTPVAGKVRINLPPAELPLEQVTAEQLV